MIDTMYLYYKILHIIIIKLKYHTTGKAVIFSTITDAVEVSLVEINSRSKIFNFDRYFRPSFSAQKIVFSENLNFPPKFFKKTENFIFPPYIIFSTDNGRIY